MHQPGGSNSIKCRGTHGQCVQYVCGGEVDTKLGLEGSAGKECCVRAVAWESAYDSRLACQLFSRWGFGVLPAWPGWHPLTVLALCLTSWPSEAACCPALARLGTMIARQAASSTYRMVVGWEGGQAGRQAGWRTLQVGWVRVGSHGMLWLAQQESLRLSRHRLQMLAIKPSPPAPVQAGVWCRPAGADRHLPAGGPSPLAGPGSDAPLLLAGPRSDCLLAGPGADAPLARLGRLLAFASPGSVLFQLPGIR